MAISLKELSFQTTLIIALFNPNSQSFNLPRKHHGTLVCHLLYDLEIQVVTVQNEEASGFVFNVFIVGVGAMLPDGGCLKIA